MHSPQKQSKFAHFQITCKNQINTHIGEVAYFNGLLDMHLLTSLLYELFQHYIPTMITINHKNYHFAILQYVTTFSTWCKFNTILYLPISFIF